MKIDFLILAEAATSTGSKLYIHGAGWEALPVASLPTGLGYVAAAMRVRAPAGETGGRHVVTIDVVDGSGESVLPVPPGPILKPVRVPEESATGDRLLCLACNLLSVPINAYGEHAVVVAIDGEEQARSTFRVVAAGSPGSGTAEIRVQAR